MTLPDIGAFTLAIIAGVLFLFFLAGFGWALGVAVINAILAALSRQRA
jgi:hypothetical protein